MSQIILECSKYIITQPTHPPITVFGLKNKTFLLRCYGIDFAPIKRYCQFCSQAYMLSLLSIYYLIHKCLLKGQAYYYRGEHNRGPWHVWFICQYLSVFVFLSVSICLCLSVLFSDRFKLENPFVIKLKLNWYWVS